MLNLDLNDIKTLLNKPQDEMQDDVLSLYLRVDNAYRPNQANNPAWSIWLKNHMRELEAEHGNNAAWQTIRSQVDDYFSDYQPRSKSLALFATAGDITAYELPVTLENQAAYGQPMVAPLVWAIDEFERYLVVLVDQERAVFTSAYLGNATQSDAFSIDLDYDWRQRTLMPANRFQAGGPGAGDNRAAMPQGNNRDRFEDMLSEHENRFYRDVVEKIDEWMQELGAERLILGGSERSANTVKSFLQGKTADRLVEILPIPVDTEAHAISEHIQQAAQNYERAQELDLVDDTINLAKANGRAVLGAENVSNALAMQQVEMIILPWPSENQQMIRNYALQALSNNAGIEFVHGSPAMKLQREGDGVAARLYYTV